MNSELLKRTYTSIVLLMFIFLCLFYNQITWGFLLSIFTVICLYEFFNLIKKIITNKFIFFIILFVFVSYLIFFQYLLYNIRFEYGIKIILILLFACIFSDIGGYFVGKSLGGPKLTRISPNKTITGAIGSIFFTIVGGLLMIIFLNLSDVITITTYIWLILMSLLCQLGDLLISFMKRKAKIKDTGRILPGHGGMLDRVDVIIIAIPFGILTLFLIF